MKRWLALLLLGVALPAFAGTPKPENRWHKIGKAAHVKVKRKSPKDKDRACAALCRKSGAKKARDLGACKEGCVFG